MNHRQKIGIAALIIAALIIGLAFFKTAPQEKAGGENAKDYGELGILDIHKVLGHHPEFSKLEQLRKELNTMKAENDSLKMLAAKKKDATEKDEEAAARASEVFPKEQQAINDTELAKESGKRQRELRREAKDELAKAINEINGEYMGQIFNIQLKLENLQLDEAVRAKYEAEKKALYDARDAAILEKKQAIEGEYGARLEEEAAALKAASAAELAALMEKNKAEESEKKQKENERDRELDERGEVAFNLTRLSENERQIAEKEKEIAALEEKIRADIKDKAMKVGAQHNLKTVINVRRHVNISAFDITDLVIAEFNS
jgi:hypothetical protein